MNEETKNYLEKNLPSPAYEMGKKIYRKKRQVKDTLESGIKNPILMYLYRRDVISGDYLYSDNYYLKRKYGEHRQRAEEFSKVVEEHLDPGSVIDFGCGIGQHLIVFHEYGKRTKGIDISEVCKKENLVPASNIEIKDLAESWDVNEEFECGLCLEVLEHIPKENTETAVKNISKSVSNTLLVSAATPNQGGTHHVNERPKEFWIEKFEKENFKYKPEITEEIKADLNFDGVRKTNLLVFQR